MAIFSCVSTHSGLHYVVVADRVLRGYISEWNAPDSSMVSQINCLKDPSEITGTIRT